MKHKPENIALDDWNAVQSAPLSDDLLHRMRPVRDCHQDRPQRVDLPTRKKNLSIGIAPEIIVYFKATGPGWQNRVEEVLRDWIARHPLR